MNHNEKVKKNGEILKMNGHWKHLNSPHFTSAFLSMKKIKFTFAGGVDEDDLFASVDARLLRRKEFSVEETRRKWCG